jgi:hypothetical protein
MPAIKRGLGTCDGGRGIEDDAWSSRPAKHAHSRAVLLFLRNFIFEDEWLAEDNMRAPLRTWPPAAGACLYVSQECISYPRSAAVNQSVGMLIPEYARLEIALAGTRSFPTFQPGHGTSF